MVFYWFLTCGKNLKKSSVGFKAHKVHERIHEQAPYLWYYANIVAILAVKW